MLLEKRTLLFRGDYRRGRVAIDSAQVVQLRPEPIGGGAIDIAFMRKSFERIEERGASRGDTYSGPALGGSSLILR